MILSILSFIQVFVGCLLINLTLTSFCSRGASRSSATAFVTNSFVPNYKSHSYYPPRTMTTNLQVVADTPIEKEGEEISKGKNGKNDDNEEDDWIPSPQGGFIPNIKTPKILQKFRSQQPTGQKLHSGSNNILKVTDIHQYKEHVVDESEVIVCVRFYMESCRSCRATQANFRRLANEIPSNLVKFVEVPVTPDNAYLHQGLSIPSFPYCHIYHPDVGLVEELKINKNVFKTFEQIFKTYVDGECAVGYDDEIGTINYHDTSTSKTTK